MKTLKLIICRVFKNKLAWVGLRRIIVFQGKGTIKNISIM